MLFVFQQLLKQSELEYEQVLARLRWDLTRAGIECSKYFGDYEPYVLSLHLNVYSETYKVGTLVDFHETGLFVDE